MVEHTKEPWQATVYTDHAEVEDSSGASIAWVEGMFRMGNAQENKANLNRIVACVNACAGLNPEAIPDALKALQEAKFILEGLGGSDELGDYYAAEVDRVDDEIIAALAKLTAKPEPHQ